MVCRDLTGCRGVVGEENMCRCQDGTGERLRLSKRKMTVQFQKKIYKKT